MGTVFVARDKVNLPVPVSKGCGNKVRGSPTEKSVASAPSIRQGGYGLTVSSDYSMHSNPGFRPHNEQQVQGKSDPTSEPSWVGDGGINTDVRTRDSSSGSTSAVPWDESMPWNFSGVYVSGSQDKGPKRRVAVDEHAAAESSWLDLTGATSWFGGGNTDGTTDSSGSTWGWATSGLGSSQNLVSGDPSSAPSSPTSVRFQAANDPSSASRVNRNASDASALSSTRSAFEVQL